MRFDPVLLGFTDPVVSTDRINEWNRDHRYGRAYIDKEGDPVVEMDVDLDKGGISRALFDDYVATWGQVGATFRTFVTE
ncbi:MAG: YbjN domain-containing protein [Sphingomonas sp.]